MSVSSRNHSKNRTTKLVLDSFNTEVLKSLLQTIASKCEANDLNYMVIDARNLISLPVVVLANELRRMIPDARLDNVFVAIVIPSQNDVQKLSNLTKTIIERGNLELFTDIFKAEMWLQLKQNCAV